MAYSHTSSKGKTYFLHGQVVPLKGGKEQQIYFFKSEVDESRALDEVPDGYMVSETKNGLPVLKKAQAA